MLKQCSHCLNFNGNGAFEPSGLHGEVVSGYVRVTEILYITACVVCFALTVKFYVCLIADEQEGYFIVAARQTIFQVSLDGTRSHILVSNTSNAVPIDYDFRYKGNRNNRILQLVKFDQVAWAY